jgi:hypothetical protein
MQVFFFLMLGHIKLSLKELDMVKQIGNSCFKIVSCPPHHTSPKIVNSIPFRLECPKYFISIQKTEQNGIIFI